MCIIAVDYAGVSKGWFDRASWTNPHGVGIAWWDGKTTNVSRSLKPKYRTYARIRKVAKGPMLLHFRLATSGLTTLKQCHPFYTQPNVVFAHNGWFLALSNDPIRSDTQIFAEDYLKGADPMRPKTAKMLNSVCDDGNKIAFLRFGVPIIFGEQWGHWGTDGNWYSYASGWEPGWGSKFSRSVSWEPTGDECWANDPDDYKRWGQISSLPMAYRD